MNLLITFRFDTCIPINRSKIIRQTLLTGQTQEMLKVGGGGSPVK